MQTARERVVYLGQFRRRFRAIRRMGHAMSRIIDKVAIERALKEAARTLTSWQYWEKQNRDGQMPRNDEPNALRLELPNYEVSRFKFPMEHLRALPAEQRAAFLVATKIANEMLLLGGFKIELQQPVI